MPNYNLRTFPNQTIIFFWIIVLSILGVMVAGAIGPSPILMWPITLTVLILPIRSFLAWPDRELKKRQDLLATAELTAVGVLPCLQTTLTMLAKDNGYYEPIKIIIGSNTDRINAVGSWRRHYLFIGQEVAQRLANDLQTPERQSVAEAALLHEIAHFLHQDVQHVGYTRELLRSSFTIILWWMFFLIGWLGFAGLMRQAFLDFDLNQIADIDPLLLEMVAPVIMLSPDERIEIMEKVDSISMVLVLNYITNAFLPIIVMGFLLWLFFWRRMLRWQEFYADYFVKSITQQPAALHTAWFDYEPQSLLITNNAQLTWSDKLQNVWQDVFFQITDKVPFIATDRHQRVIKKILLFKEWFAYHPTIDQRRTLLLNPSGIYDSWLSIAITTLALVLAIEVLLTTPLIGYYTSSYIIHFATLAIFVLLATWVLPLLAQQKAVQSSLKKSLFLIYGVRWAWISLNIGFIIFLAVVAPELASQILDSIVHTTSRIGENPASLSVEDGALPLILSIIPSYLGMQLLSLGVVLLLLFIYINWQKRIIQTNVHIDWHQQHWQLILALSITSVTLVITPLSNILLGDSHLLFRPMHLLGYLIGIGCIVWLFAQARKTYDKGNN